MDSGISETVAVSSTEDQIATEANDSPSADSPGKDGGINEPVVFSAKSHKKMSSKGSPRTSLSSLNKFKSQIKKPSHRNGSPVNWAPRQKGDTYLNRKIKRLQEASGMNSSLDETLGTANPHYCRLLREKIAAKQAAVKAMEARKAAMVEASWCRILKAARIQSKDAEALLSKADKSASEALEAATAKGVMMYDSIDCLRKQYVIETESAKGGKPMTHTVRAALETAFEVDRQVAAAVKIAFTRLAADCPSSLNKDEYIGLLRKISEKPDTDETNHQDSSDFISESKDDVDLEFELGSEEASSQSVNKMDEGIQLAMLGRSPQKYDKSALIDIMFQRLKCLKEEELASLATIVATCGLNAVLAETENQQQCQQDRRCSYATNARRTSTVGGRRFRNSGVEWGVIGLAGKQESDMELPSLDKCLIKHTTKLEREVQEARNARKNDSRIGQENPVKSTDSEVKQEMGLESILVKHSSLLEKEKAELKRKIGQIWELDTKAHGEEQEMRKGGRVKQKVEEVPSLDKFLVKHVSRLEREVQEAKSRRSDCVSKKVPLVSQLEENQSLCCSTDECAEKENIDLNKDKINIEETSGGLELNVRKDAAAESPDTTEQDTGKGEGGLDSILVKHKSKLVQEKLAAAQQHGDDQTTKPSVSRQKARERELQLAWGGMSLDSCCRRPHVSRLEREKVAWIIKSEAERKSALSVVNKALP